MPTLCPVRPSTISTFGQSYDIPGVPAGYAWELMCHANRTIHGAYFDDHYTIFVPFQPLLAESRPYAYTWLALGAARLAQQAASAESPWRAVALECHSKAVRGLHQHLQSAAVPREWALCSMLLLHIYEKFGDELQSPSGAHVTVARNNFIHRFTNFPPTHMRHILQLESLVYRIAVTHMFRRQATISQHDYHSLDELIDIWSASRITCGLWQHSLFISLRPPIFNIVFKLSILLSLAPLQPHLVADLDNLEHSLQQHLGTYEAASTDLDEADHQLDHDVGGHRLSIEAQSHAAHSLYAYACRIVTTKLRDATARQYEGQIRRSSNLGFRLLAYLSKVEFLSPVLIWPAIVIGLAASRRDDQDIVGAYINGLADLSGSRATTSVMRLLHLAWNQADADGPAGIDTLLDSEALGTVFI